jgi:hypothetical protein
MRLHKLSPLLLGSLVAGLFAFAACASEAPQATTPATTATSSTAPPPASETAPPEPAASSAAPAASSAAPPPKKPALLNVIKGAKEASGNVPSDGTTKVEVGETELATLKILDGALSKPKLVTLKLDPKGKAHGQVAGSLYRVSMTEPDGTPTTVSTAGEPFVLTLSTGGKKDLNLAIGETVTEKGKQKLVWRVVAPKSVDEAAKTATFELTSLSDLGIHLTAKEPTKEPATK